MTHATRIVAVVAVLAALVLCVPVQAQTPEIDALRALAEQGDVDAQNDLGSRFYAGGGVPQDDIEAARWIGLAAGQGHPPAQYNLGLLYFRGRGVRGDDAQAATWYRRAAEKGYAPAQGALGYMLAYGAGVDQNQVLAFMWLDLAGTGTPDDFTRGLYVQQRDELARRMTREQIVEAQRLTREWDAAHPRDP